MSEPVSPMAQGKALTGESHSRFTFVAVLLSMIDPVRGEPTAHSLDRHPHDDNQKQEHVLKKFLDSFALICSTSERGGETASAVCLEQDQPSGTILRLARNCGVPLDLIERLHHILDDLNAVALSGMCTCSTWMRTQSWAKSQFADSFATAKAKEPLILQKIINLTARKIHSLLKPLREPAVQSAILEGIQYMEKDDSFDEELEGAAFQQWISNLPRLSKLEINAAPILLMPHIKWASKAKWVYSAQIEALFCRNGQDLPSWINNIYKLGRYYAATKCMLQLAKKQPELFASNIHVEAVEAPPQEGFSCGSTKTPLMRVLQKLAKTDQDKLLEKLGQIWLTDDPEKTFRKRCRLTLTVHAEMQLLSFYDHNPKLTPRLHFMGTSKKTCFLCYEFLNRHPLKMGVSACHQKLYPSWMPAPSLSSGVRKRHKVLLWEFTRSLEQTTARDLETRLGILRPKSLDSSAGVSLPTTTSSNSEWFYQQLPVRLSNPSSESSAA
jgi:hypothetical protein